MPLYHQMAEGQAPAWTENLLVETGLAAPLGRDSLYVLLDSHNLHTGIRYGTVSLSGGFSLTNKHLAWTALVLGAVFFLTAAALTGVLAAPAAPPPAKAIEEQAAEESVAPAEPDNGVVTPARLTPPPASATPAAPPAAQDGVDPP